MFIVIVFIVNTVNEVFNYLLTQAFKNKRKLHSFIVLVYPTNRYSLMQTDNADNGKSILLAIRKTIQVKLSPLVSRTAVTAGVRCPAGPIASSPHTERAIIGPTLGASSRPHGGRH